MNRKALSVLLISVGVSLSMILAYFGRPKPPSTELVSPRQELVDFEKYIPSNTNLVERVSKLYGLALIMVRSPYLAENAIALDALRTWAANRFQREPGFLHPIALEAEAVPSQTILGTLFYNLGAYPYYALEDLVCGFLKGRIAAFHHTHDYASFRASYFELFGIDADTATLLARYQSERAMWACNVILWILLWIASIGLAAWAILKSKSEDRFECLQLVLGRGLLLLALCYLVIAFSQSSISALISAVVSALAGLYLRCPFVFARQTDSFSFTRISMPTGWVAFAAWLAFSLICIQMLTWIRTGSLINPDPITLLLSGLSGDFVHDPAAAKRLIMRIVGIGWLLLGLWTIRQSRRDAKAAYEAKEKLASLERPILP